MGLKVIAVDIAEQALEEAKACGADHVFNSIQDKGWKERVLEITSSGVDAAVNFTASKKSYDDCPGEYSTSLSVTPTYQNLAIIKPGQGLLMVVGIPQEPLQLNALDIALCKYRVKGSNNGSKWLQIKK